MGAVLPNRKEKEVNAKMTRYPFGEKASEFMETRRGVLTEVSYKNLDRRLRRIERELIRLKEDGKISSLSPKSMTEDDIKAFLIYRKGKRVGGSDISHDISALDQLLSYSDNTAVQKCLRLNPGLKPTSKRTRRLDPLSEDTYRAVLRAYEDIDHQDFRTVRAFALVLTYIGTGARNKELRLANVSDLDTNEWIIHYELVKGEETYGEPRNVPIPQELIPVMKQYLYDRDVYLAAHHAKSSALFFQLGGKFDHLSGNSIRTSKKIVEALIGQKFELRDCRRGFGDMYIKKGLSIEQVSVLMGHASTRTTEHYYCRKCEREVINEAKKLW